MKPKVLLLQGSLSSYRVPIYNIIAKHVDLTIAYNIKNEALESCSFNIIKLETRKIAGLFFVRNHFFKLCSQYDIVIYMADMHYLSYCILPFINRTYKVIPWTIGVRASYKRRYDVNRKIGYIDKIYSRILNHSDAVIFYMNDAVLFWRNRIDKEKVFIAHNTVKVLDRPFSPDLSEKKNILFIGTLYKEKKIYELIYAYMRAKKNCLSPGFPLLEIIGKGDEFENIKSLVKDSGFDSCINLRGAIYDEEVLAKYFQRSLVCISPDQAGLSVLKSMGYGVPYVTRYDAITGGERFNIKEEITGLFYSEFDQLVKIIEEVHKNPTKFLVLGKNAQEYYRSHATPEHMAQGVLDAISYVLEHE